MYFNEFILVFKPVAGGGAGEFLEVKKNYQNIILRYHNIDGS